MLIDMHAHVVPASFPARPGSGRWPWMDHFEEGQARLMFGETNFRTLHAGNWQHERRLRDMAAAGVDAEVVSPMPAALLPWAGYAPEDALALCQCVNEWVAGFCAAAPDRFYGLGLVPLQDPDLAAKTLAEVQALGLQGIELGSHVLGRSLGDARFLDFFQEVDRSGLCVFVHAFEPTCDDRLVGPAAGNAIGYPTDEGLTIASLIGGGTAERCPTLRIAFSHGGGTFASMLPRYDNAWSGQWNGEPPVEGSPRGREFRAVLPHAPSTYARRFYYDTLVFEQPLIRFLIELVGASQLLVGTDYPYFPREQPVGRTLRLMGLSDAVLNGITWDNCFRFLGVAPPAP